MKKPMKYILSILAVVLVLFLSLDIQKLEAYKASNTSNAFDPAEYARKVWDRGIPEAIRNAPEFTLLADLLKTDPHMAFETFGRKLGISDTWYFMVAGEGMIESLEEDDLLVVIDANVPVRLATGFIFGNAVRDGSGAVNIDDFVNMTGFNNVSVALNNIVKAEVVPELKEAARAGMKLKFTGAFEWSEERSDLASIRIIPVSAQLSYE